MEKETELIFLQHLIHGYRFNFLYTIFSLAEVLKIRSWKHLP